MHPLARDLPRYYVLLFSFSSVVEQIRATISVYNRKRGRRDTKGREGRSPDWLINIKMPVLVKGIVYIYYGRYTRGKGVYSS